MDAWIWGISGFASGVLTTLMVQDVRQARRKLALMRAEFQRVPDALRQGERPEDIIGRVNESDR